MNDAIEVQSVMICKQIIDFIGVIHENADDIVDSNKEIDVILTKLDNCGKIIDDLSTILAKKSSSSIDKKEIDLSLQIKQMQHLYHSMK